MSTTIKIGFYKNPYRFKIIHALIRWWTKSIYSHVQICVGDVWYSAEPGGVVKFDKPKRPFAYDELDIALDVTDENLSKTVAFLEEQVGKGYDFTGIMLSQILPLEVDNRSRWFCSELTTKALKLLGDPLVAGIKKSNSMSPGDLARLYGVEQ